MTFGKKLKAARTEAGLKQSELAKQLKTTGNTISNWENNVSKPDLDTLSYICGILHVTASYFLQPTLPEDEVSIKELKMIKKYRDLDDPGRETVDIVIDRESQRTAQLRRLSTWIANLETASQTDLENPPDPAALSVDEKVQLYHQKLECEEKAEERSSALQENA
ncbi:MAG: helix-turn-helix domain-containing protein [Clostridiales bacterium]|nr:helix-turn-helix domain-containing protein [Clostridiales bacterium]